ncbi:acetyl-CoA carboxylase biotin carboxyl carrier protein [Rubrobacter indicoceani]|uniref:acetyl-CoA carboxylase biotin carboxyl carrier protein n=1 Tax=Rubrobacter indicoceani TaxID=2051957 RepID=UPI000E5A6E26
MPFREVERLTGLLKESGLAEISVKNGDLEISVKAAFAAPLQAGPRPTVQGASPEEEPEVGHRVKSPLVGTFYRSPAPSEGPFVEVGQKVRAGQTLCIVEAMKLMNEIPADISGEVVEVLVADGSGVEFDEPLFAIRPE